MTAETKRQCEVRHQSCVTGVPDVTTLIATGDRLAVDGYLGIVTVL